MFRIRKGRGVEVVGYVFVLGGARSGKSHFAEQWAKKKVQESGRDVVYLATGQALDDEMQTRIEKHQAERPATWMTQEVPCEVATWLVEQREARIVILDCLSLLVSNWLFYEEANEARLQERTLQLVQALQETKHHVVVVSNEVGQGIVPGDELSRRYRDALGILNQQVAQRADAVYVVFAGMAVDVKKLREVLP